MGNGTAPDLGTARSRIETARVTDRRFVETADAAVALKALDEMERRAAECIAAAGPGELDQAGVLVARYILIGFARPGNEES